MNELIVNDKVETTNGQKILKKPSGSIYIESDSINMLARKTFNVLLENAQNNLSDTFHYIDMDSFRLGIDSQSRDSYIKSMLSEIRDTKIKWDVIRRDKKREWGITSLIGGARIVNNQLRYSFTAELKELLMNPQTFALIDIQIQNRFSSKYALTLYELTVDWCREKEGKGETPFFSIDDFRVFMGVSNVKSYKTYANLRKFVIEAPIKEINKHSAYTLQYKAKKEGRSYSHIKFFIKRKPGVQQKNVESAQKTDIPVEILNLIPLEQQPNAKGICRSILAKEGQEVAKFYLEYAAKYTKGSWGPYINTVYRKEIHKTEMQHIAAEKEKAEAAAQAKAAEEKAAAKANEAEKARYAECEKLVSLLTDSEHEDMEEWIKKNGPNKFQRRKDQRKRHLTKVKLIKEFLEDPANEKIAERINSKQENNNDNDRAGDLKEIAREAGEILKKKGREEPKKEVQGKIGQFFEKATEDEVEEFVKILEAYLK